MREYKVAICDDEEFYLEEIEKHVSVFGNEMELSIVYRLFAGGDDLMQAIADGELFDFYLLDIDMPGISGIDVAEQLRKTEKHPTICFITSYEDYTANAYQVKAEAYIMKPVKYLDLKEALSKMLILADYKKNSEEAKNRYLRLKTGSGYTTISIQRILYIEKRRNQCIFHMVDGELTCYETLKNIYPKLNPGQFFFTHQGYIVNMEHVKEVDKEFVHLGNNIDVPLSRSRIKEMKSNFEKMLLGGISY